MIKIPLMNTDNPILEAIKELLSKITVSFVNKHIV